MKEFAELRQTLLPPRLVAMREAGEPAVATFRELLEPPLGRHRLRADHLVKCRGLGGMEADEDVIEVAGRRDYPHQGEAQRPHPKMDSLAIRHLPFLVHAQSALEATPLDETLPRLLLTYQHLPRGELLDYRIRFS